MHPIVARVQPSREQAPAVLAQDCDVVVVAGAGTGKTRTLVARMLHLLAGGVELRRIVAVTFTIKAAREMRNRLRDEIQQYLAQDDLASAERRFWQEVDASLDAARIGTIHGLCTELLRNHPAEAAIDPAFGVLDEAQAALLLQDAATEAIGWAADDADAVQLFRLFAPSGLEELLSQLLRNRLTAAPLLAQAPWAQWPQLLGDLLLRALLDSTVQDVLGRFVALHAEGTIQAAADRGDELAADLLQLLAWYGSLPGSTGERAGAECQAANLTYAELAQLCSGLVAMRGLLKGNRGKAPLWKPATPPKDEVKQLREHYDDVIAPLLKGADPLLDSELAGLLPQLQRLFAAAEQCYTAAKAERGMLDFDDLEQRALDLLQGSLSVRARWQQEIRALLVDEFQDTNARQRDLVRLLNGDSRAGAGGRLFLVGDAKQSIYRFRGADVQVFRSEQARLAGGQGQSYDLTVSYRTHAPLLGALNHLLAVIMGTQDNPQQPWRAPFQPLQAARPACDFGLAAPHIELQLAAGSKSSGAAQRAAAALAARLAQLVAESAAAGGGLHYGRIAILCRSYRGFGPYEDALEAAGIPYVAVAGRGFYTRPEIRDLLNALAALADPSDDLALAGLLRSPAIGLSDVELFNLRCAPDGSVRPLWPALQAAADARSRAAAALIGALHTAAGRIGVADLLKQLLDATDYTAKLLLAGQARAARNVAKLLDDARRSGLVSAGAFLEYVRHVRDVGGREGEARADETGAVQIMTVHQAKGLEFPVVVIGDAAASGGGRAGAVLFDAQLGVAPLVTNSEGDRPLVCRLAALTEQMMEEAESDRLLYVAATRAADKLILNGHVRVASRGELKGDGWLGQVLQSLQIGSVPASYDEAGAQAHRFDAWLQAERVQCSLYEPNFSAELTTGATDAAAESGGAAWLEPLLAPLAAPALAPEDERRVWRVVPHTDVAYAPAWIIGRLVHETIAGWRLPLDASFAAWAAARCRDWGIADAARLRHAAARARRLLGRFVASPLFRTIAAADQRLHEIPYSYLTDGEFESGSIDLLYRVGEAWTVVDFKTDHIRTPGEREQIIRSQAYDRQLARYVAAVEQLIGQRPAACLCLLDDADQVRVWPEP
jgi:ATP-dependent helicase/nuclease subunit A